MPILFPYFIHLNITNSYSIICEMSFKTATEVTYKLQGNFKSNDFTNPELIFINRIFDPTSSITTVTHAKNAIFEN